MSTDSRSLLVQDRVQAQLNLHTLYGWHRQRVIRRLVELYAGSGRDERAAEYQALLSVEAAAS